MTERTGTAREQPPGGVWPLVLLRYRSEFTRHAPRVAHLVPLPPAHQAGIAFCGALLRPDLVEMVTPGQGAPCTFCATNRRDRTADRNSVTTRYREWGWPVTPRAHQVWLDLEPDTVALTIPAPLATHAGTILTQWGCPPPTLMIHPDAPGHRVVLAAQRHSMAPPYPRGVHRITGALPLPPSTTPRGPLTWAHPPKPGPLRLCREFEVFAALRTVLRVPADRSGRRGDIG